MNMGVFYTALSAMLYGCIGYFGVELMAAGFSVCDLLLWRFVVSFVLLLPFAIMIWKRGEYVDKRSFMLLFAISGICYGGGTACYFEASRTIGTGLGMVIFFTYPIFVAILSVLTKKAPLSLATVVSLALIIVGSICIALGDGLSFDVDMIGLTFALISGASYGLYVFFSKESSKAMSPYLSAFIVCLGNSVAFSIYALLVKRDLLLPTTFVVWKDIFLFAFIGTVLPIFLLLRGMKSLSANKASIISVLEPVAVLAVGAFILNENVTWLQFFGAIVILLSAVVVQFDKESPPVTSTT